MTSRIDNRSERAAGQVAEVLWRRAPVPVLVSLWLPTAACRHHSCTAAEPFSCHCNGGFSDSCRRCPIPPSCSSWSSWHPPFCDVSFLSLSVLLSAALPPVTATASLVILAAVARSRFYLAPGFHGILLSWCDCVPAACSVTFRLLSVLLLNVMSGFEVALGLHGVSFLRVILFPYCLVTR